MLTIINDCHLGVTRVAGTTPRSAAALGTYAANSFEALLANVNTDLCILGDLFDQYLVPNTSLIRTFFALADWLENGYMQELHLVAGNHDLSKDSSRLSSFETLGQLLVRQFADRVHIYRESSSLAGHKGIWVIPHLTNQDQFNLALAGVPEDTRYALLHANYDNGFAEQADHSLNVSAEQAAAMPCSLVFAHEHQQRDLRAGDNDIVIIGNQFPTSVADCLGNGTKRFLQIGLQGHKTVTCWTTEGAFAQIDWSELAEHTNSIAQFIRVTGEASAQQSSDVVSRIAKFRAMHEALVITNSVKIEGVEGSLVLPESVESATSFDVLTAVMETLDPPEQVVIKKLLETEQ